MLACTIIVVVGKKAFEPMLLVGFGMSAFWLKHAIFLNGKIIKKGFKSKLKSN